MATNSDKKLTRYTSAVTVVTAEVMNSLFGGEYGSNTSLDAFHPLVGGHVHDGEHVDGHASKILLSNGSHVRGYLSHSNLGGSDGTTPAVQVENIQCYSENVYGPNGGGLSIPEYTTDPDTGERCYYLDLSMTIGGPDKSIQFNQNGEFSGSNDFVYDYATGHVGIGTDIPSSKLEVFGDGKFNGDLEVDGKLTVTGLIDPTGLILSEEYASNVPTGEGFGAIFVSKDDSPQVKNKIYYKDAEGNIIPLGGANSLSELSDVDIDQESLAPGAVGRKNVLSYNSESGKWQAAPSSDGLIRPNIITWPPSGNIVLDLLSKGSLNIITGVWNGSGKIVVPGSLGQGSDDWVIGDNFYIKNLTTYTVTSDDHMVTNSHHNYHVDSHGDSSVQTSPYLIEIVPDNGVDKLDADLWVDPFVLLPKNTIRFCCTKGDSGENNWILVSHYHAVHHAPDQRPLAIIDANDQYGGSAVNEGDSISMGSQIALSGRNSYDPDGDAITDYKWTVSYGYSSQQTFTGESISIDTYVYGETSIDVELIVTANGVDSDPATFSFSVYNPNRAPVVSITGPTVVGEDNSTVTLNANASDLDGDTLIYNWGVGSIPSGSGVSISNTLSSSITVSLDLPGTYEFGVVVSDGQVNSSDTHTVRLDAKPVINLIGDSAVKIPEGVGYSDPGATGSDYEDGSVTVNSVSNVMPDDPGSYTITYNAEDSFGQSADTVTRIVEVIAAPVITLNGDSLVQIIEGGSYSELGAVAIDGEGADISDRINIDGTIDSGIIGFQQILTYKVVDDLGQEASVERRVIFIANAAPTITVSPETETIEQGSTYDLTRMLSGVSASDAEDGDLTDQIVVSGSVQTSANGDKFVVTSSTGTKTVTYDVIDSSGKAAAQKTRSVIVEATNVGPIITNITAESLGSSSSNHPTVNKDITISADISDTDGMVTMYKFGILGTPQGTYSLSRNSWSSVTPQPSISVTSTLSVDTEQEITIEIQAKDDAGAQSSETFVVNVVNNPPVISVSPTSVTISEGDTYGDSEIMSGVLVSDSEDDNFGLSHQVTYSSSPALNPNAEGTYVITYNVTDSGGKSAVPKTRTVIVESVNTAPVITVNPLTVVINQGDVYGEAEMRSGVSASDAEQGNMTSSVIIDGSVDSSTPGDYSLVYRLTDSGGLSAIPRTRTVTVQAYSDNPPTVGPITVSNPNGSIAIRQQNLLSATISDDNNITSYQWSIISEPDGATYTFSPDSDSGNFGTSKAVSTKFNTSKEGFYTAKLLATDSNGASGFNTKQFEVQKEGNTPPVAEVGFLETDSQPTDYSITGLNYSSPIVGSKGINVSKQYVSFNASTSTDLEEGFSVHHEWFILRAPNNSLLAKKEGYLGNVNPPAQGDDSQPFIMYHYNSAGERDYMAMRLDVRGLYVVAFRLRDQYGITSNMVQFELAVL